LLATTFAVMLGLSWLVHRYAERPVARWVGIALNAGLGRVHKLRPAVVERRSRSHGWAWTS